MANTIEEFATSRGITEVVHFTRASNLTTILRQGLITKVAMGGHVEGCNDPLRLDGTDAICASISFPNYKMFYRLQCENPGVDWVVLELRPSVLWTTRCAFCSTNAASNGVTSIPLADRQSLASIEAMFEDFGGKQRLTLGIPSSYSTNPQAEVLILDGVPLAGIIGIAVPDTQRKRLVEQSHQGVTAKVVDRYFRPRMDYAHWR